MLKYLVIAILALAFFGHGPLAMLGTKLLVMLLILLLVLRLPGIIGGMIKPRKNV